MRETEDSKRGHRIIKVIKENRSVKLQDLAECIAEDFGMQLTEALQWVRSVRSSTKGVK